MSQLEYNLERLETTGFVWADDIVSICSDILEEEVRKSKKRHHRALFNVPPENKSGNMNCDP